LFAFKNKVIGNIPLDVAEDAIIPYIFYEKGYNIKYAPNAMVYVKNPTNWKDWIEQKKRAAKAHENIHKYADTKRIPRVKTFYNEVIKGSIWALMYPRSLREFYWTVLLFFTRLYMWIWVMVDTKIKRDHYKDAWKRIETAR